MGDRVVHGAGRRTTTVIEVSPRVHCATSAATVEGELTGLTGVVRARADAATGRVEVTFRPDLLPT